MFQEWKTTRTYLAIGLAATSLLLNGAPPAPQQWSGLWRHALLTGVSSPGDESTSTPDPREGWQPGPARVRQLLYHPRDPHHRYVVSAGGSLYVSDDSTHWTQRETGSAVATLAIGVAEGATVLYASLKGGQLMRSTDDGVSWQMTSLPGSENSQPVVLAVDGHDSAHVVASGDALWETQDGGETWQPLPDAGNVTALAVAGDGTVIAGTTNGQSFA
jgi:hypothetical protein